MTSINHATAFFQRTNCCWQPLESKTRCTRKKLGHDWLGWLLFPISVRELQHRHTKVVDQGRKLVQPLVAHWSYIPNNLGGIKLQPELPFTINVSGCHPVNILQGVLPGNPFFWTDLIRIADHCPKDEAVYDEEEKKKQAQTQVWCRAPRAHHQSNLQVLPLRPLAFILETHTAFSPPLEEVEVLLCAKKLALSFLVCATFDLLAFIRSC